MSGLIASASDTPPEGRRKIIKDRYDSAMTYLKSYETDESGGSLPKSKLSKYVEKQDMWAKAVEMYSIAQERQLGKQQKLKRLSFSESYSHNRRSN